MIKWLIESSSIDTHTAHEIQAFKDAKVNFEQFSIKHFTTWITPLNLVFQDPEDSYIIRSGTKILMSLNTVTKFEDIVWPEEKISSSILENKHIYLQKLKAGIFYEVKNFDQKFYQQFDLPLLNNKGQLFDLSIKENLQLSFDTHKFIKPTRDLKAFSAGVLNPGQTVENFLNKQTHDDFIEEEFLLVAPAKNVLDEYRFFVLGQEVITGSQYRANKQLKYKSMTSSQEHQKVWCIAQEYAKLYQPAEMFVLDIARDDLNQYTIIEYNSFNCAGLYASDAVKLFSRVTDYIENKSGPKNKWIF